MQLLEEKKWLDLKWNCTQLYSIDSKEQVTPAYMLPNKKCKTVCMQMSNERAPKDQNMETKYNKPTKGSSESAGYTQKEENVLKMNIRCHHKKRDYTDDFLYGICCFHDDNKYSFRRKFSHAINQRDKICFSHLVTYIAQ